MLKKAHCWEQPIRSRRPRLRANKAENPTHKLKTNRLTSRMLISSSGNYGR